ncbi:MAG TPA: insulinase family protein [Ferruginibacter sp.]|nr:insulinase family protein [Ferruginibacter sp.]
MKKIVCLILGATLVMQGFAQIDRSKQPKPGPAPEISIKDPETFTLPNGITVMVVENHKLPKVSVTYSIDMGPVREGNKAGVMSLMGQMLNEGTKNMNKARFDKEVDMIGADVSLYAGGGSASALTRYFNKAFTLMADALRNPAFNQESFEKLKKQTITGLKTSEKSASAIAGRVGQALSFGKNTAMGEFETEETINNITLQDTKEYYSKYITPSRGYLIFVGDITPGAAKTLAMKALGDWKGNKLVFPEFSQVSNPEKTEINFVDLPTATQGEISVSNLITNPMSNPDYHKLLIANQILGGGSDSKLFMNLREKHGFTYGSYSSIGSGRFQSLFKATAQVRSEKADSAVAEIFREIENMRNGNITQEELDIAKAKYNGSFALGMEEPSRAATYASNIMINNLPKDFYKTFLQKINAVTITDVQFVSNKYLKNGNSRVTIVGNASKILPNLERLGYPVKMYDKYANPVEMKKEGTDVAETPKSPEAVSAASLVNSYLTAIGGKEEVAKISSIKMDFTMEAMGATLEGNLIKKAPSLSSMEIRMGTMSVMKEVFDGTKGYSAQMGQKTDMDAETIKERLDDKAPIPQLLYITNDYQTSYTGTAKVGSEDAYVLKVTKPSGKVVVEYYGMKSGLLLKEESTEKQGDQEFDLTTEYSNYKKVGNLMLPHTITQIAGGQEMSMQVSKYYINEGVTDADFK